MIFEMSAFDVELMTVSLKQSMNQNYIISTLFIWHYVILLDYSILHYIRSYIYFTTYLQFILK